MRMVAVAALAWSMLVSPASAQPGPPPSDSMEPSPPLVEMPPAPDVIPSAQPGPPLPDLVEPSPPPVEMPPLAPEDTAPPAPGRQASPPLRTLYASVAFARGAILNADAAHVAMSGLHGSLGAQAGPAAGVNYRVGLAVDVFFAQDSVAAIGVEAQIDHPTNPLDPRLRFGGRASLSLSSRGRPAWMIGMRMRHRAVSVGLDLVGIGSRPEGMREDGVGVMGSLGLEGTAATFAIGVVAIVLMANLPIGH